MTDLPHIGLVISGGTLTALAEDPYEICDYGQAGSYTVPEVVRQFGHLDQRFRVTEVPFDPVPSFDMGFTKWRDIYTSCRVTLAQNPDIEGFVLTQAHITRQARPNVNLSLIPIASNFDYNRHGP